MRDNRRPVAAVGTTGDEIMKRDNLVRLTRFKVNEKRRQVEQLELMMGEFARMAAELDAQILSEEKKAGISDIAHFAYPTFAKAARARRDNLTNSVKDLKVQLNAARIVQEEAEVELVNAEKLEQRDEAEERRAATA
jgi:flagellar export protein FliJ